MLDPGYKRLNGKTGILGSRNSTFFSILVGLVVLLAFFFMYISASNEASILREELENQKDHITKLKNEILETTVSLEKARSSESACHNGKSMIEKKVDELSTEIDKLKGKISDMESTVSEKEETIKTLKQSITEKDEKLAQDEANRQAMTQTGVGQEAVILKLNETLQLMKTDLALKDNIIHELKIKAGLPVEVVNQQLNLNETNAGPDSVTLPSFKKENENEENVIPLPNKPKESEHLSALDVPGIKNEENAEDHVEGNIQQLGNKDTNQNNGGNVVVRDAKARMKLNDEVQEEKNEDEREELVDAIDFGGAV